MLGGEPLPLSYARHQLKWVNTDIAAYGIDWSGPIPNFDDAGSVEVTETRNPLKEQDSLYLQATVSPLSYSECHGVGLYIQTLQFIHKKLLF